MFLSYHLYRSFLSCLSSQMFLSFHPFHSFPSFPKYLSLLMSPSCHPFLRSHPSRLFRFLPTFPSYPT
jgi:hypothetical protein